MVPGRGIRIDRVVPGSVLANRGVHSGALLTRVGDTRVDRPLSVLEWARAWNALAVTPP